MFYPYFYVPRLSKIYRVFHQFRQAKFAYGFDIMLKPIFIIALAASKNDARHKSGQNCLTYSEFQGLDLR
jgi:hypothetical protein